MKETEGVLKDLMEEIHQKNLRYARALKAGGPEVGIFWDFDGKLLVAGKPSRGERGKMEFKPKSLRQIDALNSGR